MIANCFPRTSISIPKWGSVVKAYQLWSKALRLFIGAARKQFWISTFNGCVPASAIPAPSNLQTYNKLTNLNIPLSPPYLSTNQLNTACKSHTFKQTHHYQQIVSQPHALPCSLSAKAGDTHPFRRSSLAFAPNLLHQTAYWTDYVQLFFIRYRTTPLTEGYRLPLYVLCLPSGGI